MKKRWILTAAVLLLVCGTVHAAFTYSAANFRWNTINLLKENGDLDNWANEIEDYLDGTSPLPAPDKIHLTEISAPSGNPATNTGWLYAKDDGGGTTVLYFEDSAGTVTSCIAGAGTPAGSDTQMQYNNNGAFGAISGFVWDDTYVRVNDDQRFAFGTDPNWTIEYDEAVDDQLLFLTANTTCTATTDPMFEIIVGASPTADQQVFGVAKGTQSSNTALFTVDEDGDGVFAGSLTLGSTLYQTAVVAAASGNQNLTIDAAGNGTITLAATSTGKIVHTTNTELDADVDLGDSTADSISVNGLIVTNVTLDDGTTDSPTLTLQDATNETVTIVKSDGDDVLVTLAAGEDFEIVTGNLAVGNGSPGSAAMDGEDFYVNGDAEIDGSVYLDGNVTLSGASNVLRTNEAITFTHTANGAADDLTISQAGNADASLILQSAGSGTDALSLSTVTNSGDIKINSHDKIDMDATGTFALNVAGDTLLIQVDSDGAADDLSLVVDGDDDSSIILNSDGTGADAVRLYASNAAGGIDVDCGTNGYNMTTTGTATISASDDITIQVTSGGAGEDLLITQVGENDSSVVITAGGNGSDALALQVTEGTLDIDANDVTIDVNDDYALTVGDDVTYTITGDWTWAVTGAINVGGSPLTNVYRTIDDSNQVLTATLSGQVCTNQGDADNNIWTLPTAAAGLTFTFIDVESGAAADIYIKAAAGDTINGGNAAEYYACKTDSHPQSVTLIAVNETEWYSAEEVGTWVADDTPD